MHRHILAPVVRALVAREFREYRHHRSILVTALGLPLVFLFLPALYLASFGPDATAEQARFAVGQAVFTLFLTPVIVPAAMAAYSIIGEKETGTLEPVLTLPLTDHQFLQAKIIAIVTPAAVIALSVFAGYYLIGLLAFENPVRSEALSFNWAFGVVLMTVPLALYSTLVGMNISARSKDLRVAEQLAGLIILPTLVPISLVTFQVLPTGMATWLGFLGLVVAVDLLLLRIAYRMFERERIIAMAA